MGLLRANAMRVYFSDNGILSDKTEAARSWGSPFIPIAWVGAQDALYIGRPHTFSFVYAAMATPSAAPLGMTVSYWDRNAKAWKPFSDLTDETSGFAKDGFIYWDESPVSTYRPVTPIRWDRAAPVDVPALSSLTFSTELFWVKITLDGDTSANTAIRAIKTILSDDRLLGVAHPEVMNYLSEGATDFMPQHELAKEEIINTLITKGLISYEEQLKNPEDWFLAATYKTIELILAPIAGDDRLKAVKDEMREKAKNSLLLSAASIDKNKDEKLDREERQPGKCRELER